MIAGRAETDEAKERVMARLLRAWKLQPSMRLGQLIVCAVGIDPFNTEDIPLTEAVEHVAEEHDRFRKRPQ